MGKNESLISERELIVFFKKTYSDYYSLFERHTSVLSNLDPTESPSCNIPKRFKKLADFTLFDEFTTNPKQWVSMEIVRRMQKMLNSPSLKDYLLNITYQIESGSLFDTYFNLAKTNAPPELVEKGARYLRPIFEHNPYKKRTNKKAQMDPSRPPQFEIFLRRAVVLNRQIEIRAFIGLMDLTILFSREMVEKPKMKFSGTRRSILIEENDPLKLLIEKLGDSLHRNESGLLNESTIEVIFKAFGATAKNVNRTDGQIPRAQDLFENNRFFKSFLIKNFRKAIKEEPFLLYVFPKYTHTIPLVSAGKNVSLSKLLSSKKHNKRRTDIRIRRATLLMRSLSNALILHNERERDVLVRFLTAKGFADTRGFPETSLNRYYHELFSAK